MIYFLKKEKEANLFMHLLVQRHRILLLYLQSSIKFREETRVCCQREAAGTYPALSMLEEKSDKSYKKIKMIKSWAFVSNSSQYNVINFSKFVTVGSESLIELCTLYSKNKKMFIMLSLPTPWKQHIVLQGSKFCIVSLRMCGNSENIAAI